MKSNFTNTTSQRNLDCVNDGDGPLFFGYLTIVCIILAIPTNFILIFTVFVYQKLRTSTNLLMVNIAVVNVLYGSIIMPIFVNDTLFKKGHNSHIVCHILMVLGNWLTGVVLYTFTCIAVMRFVAIVYPIKYQRYFKTIASVALQIIICILVPALYVFPYYLSGHNVKHGKCHNSKRCHFKHVTKPSIAIFMWGIGIGMPFIVIAFSYVKVFLEIRRKRLKLKFQNEETGFCKRLTMQSNQGKAEVKMKKREIRLAIVTSIIFFIYFLSFIPTAVYRSYETIRKVLLPESFLYSSLIIYWASLAIDPLIYGLMNPEFRRGLLNIFKRCFSIGTIEPVVSVSTTSQPRSRASSCTILDVRREGASRQISMKGSQRSLNSVDL